MDLIPWKQLMTGRNLQDQKYKKSFSFFGTEILCAWLKTAKNERAEAEGCFGHMHSLACRQINL